jgi:hypothetical protein
VDLVVDEVVELQHVHDADRHVLVEGLARPTIEEDRLTALREAASASAPLMSAS